ncbi:MAG: hypothetical protein RL701_1432 [Pseudomonadota bacterium]|jgi:hypothetical protein
MLSQPEQNSIRPEVIGRLSHIETLCEADAPLIYILRSEVLRQDLLAYVADETDAGIWVVLAPCSSGSLRALKNGQLSVRDALGASWAWLARMPDYTGEVSALWSVELTELPQEHLPRQGTPLYPEHEAVITTRAIGEGIAQGTTPASVIAHVASATRKAYKAVLDHLLSVTPSSGRPTDQYRALFDLPVQRFAFNSFQVEFGAPQQLFTDPKIRRATDLLMKGLSWAADESAEPLTLTSIDERSAVLQAVLHFTPPLTGVITQIEVDGTWLHSKPTLLTRSSRKKVRAEMKTMHSDTFTEHMGRLGEVDRDNFTCTLRGEGGEHRATFDDELLDDVLDIFTDGRTVKAIGIERGGRFYISAFVSTESASPPSP